MSCYASVCCKDAHAWNRSGQYLGRGSTAVSDLQYLDSHADLFADSDALDDDQTETN